MIRMVAGDDLVGTVLPQPLDDSSSLCVPKTRRHGRRCSYRLSRCCSGTVSWSEE